MLDYFDIVWAEEKSVTRKHDERYKTEFHMYLDEKDNRPEELKSLRPNGFTEETMIDDFPLTERVSQKSSRLFYKGAARQLPGNVKSRCLVLLR